MDTFLGKNIKYLRERKGIDQQKFADILNVPRSTLACWESNLRTPKLEQIVTISKYFNVGLEIVYTDFENNTPLPLLTTEEDYKKILKSKGLMDDNNYINEEKLDELLQIADMMKKFNKKED